MKIEVKVKPNSGSSKIIKLLEDKYQVNLKATPNNNKANLELIKLLTRYFKKDIKIVKGKTSKNKIIKVK